MGAYIRFCQTKPIIIDKNLAFVSLVDSGLWKQHGRICVGFVLSKNGFVRPRSRRPAARTTCVRLGATLAPRLGFVWGFGALPRAIRWSDMRWRGGLFARVTARRGGGTIWVDEDGNVDADAAGGFARGAGGIAGSEFPARAEPRMARKRPLAVTGRIHRRVPGVRGRGVRAPALRTGGATAAIVHRVGLSQRVRSRIWSRRCCHRVTMRSRWSGRRSR